MDSEGAGSIFLLFLGFTDEGSLGLEKESRVDWRRVEKAYEHDCDDGWSGCEELAIFVSLLHFMCGPLD